MIIMECDCGHNPALHTDEGGCLFFIDREKQIICKCMNTTIGTAYRAMLKRNWRQVKTKKGIQYTNMLS